MVSSFESCIVVCAPQRSGTTVLRQSLAQTDAFHDYNEIFHHIAGDNKYNFFNFLRSDPKYYQLYLYPSSDNLENLVTAYFDFLKGNCHKKFFFVDIKYNSTHHFNPIWYDPLSKPKMFDFLAKLNIPILHIKRENLFEQSLSTVVANQIGKWHITKDEQIEDKKFKVHPQNLYSKMLRLERLYNIFNDYLADYPIQQTIYYEQMFSGEQFSDHCKKAIKDLCGYEIDPKTELTLKKINPSPSSRLSNLSELRNFFAKTRFKDMVEATIAAE